MPVVALELVVVMVVITLAVLEKVDDQTSVKSTFLKRD